MNEIAEWKWLHSVLPVFFCPSRRAPLFKKYQDTNCSWVAYYLQVGYTLKLMHKRSIAWNSVMLQYLCWDRLRQVCWRQAWPLGLPVMEVTFELILRLIITRTSTGCNTKTYGNILCQFLIVVENNNIFLIINANSQFSNIFLGFHVTGRRFSLPAM